MLGFKGRKSYPHIPCLYLLCYATSSSHCEVCLLPCVDYTDRIVPNGDDCQWETLIWVFVGDYNQSAFPLGHKCSLKLGLRLE